MSRGLYKLLLFAYSGEFRLRFGSQMLSTCSELICDEWKYNGLLGVARVWRSALGEVFSVAVQLQLQNSIVVAISLSFLCSSTLFLTIFRAMTHACDSK